MVDVAKLDPEVQRKVYKPSEEETTKVVHVNFQTEPTGFGENEAAMEVDLSEHGPD